MWLSDESVRVLQLFFNEGIKTDAEMEVMRQEMNALPTSMAIGLYIVNRSAAVGSDVFVNNELSGLMIGRYALDPLNYSDYIDEAFTMNVSAVSPVIKTDGGNAGSYVIHKLPKTEDHFEKNYDTVENSYIDNLIGKKIEEKKSALLSLVFYTDAYKNLTHSEISMD